MAIIPANTPWTLDANWEELGNTPTQIFPAAGGSYWKTSNGARRRYTTSARKLSLGYFATAAMASRGYGPGLIINGRPIWFSPVAVAANAYGTFDLYLPAGANKTVEILVPGQYTNVPISAGGSSTLSGIYPTTVMFDAPATELAPLAPAETILWYGDSIIAEGSAVNAMFTCANLTKFDGTGRGCVNVSYGSRALHDDVTNTTTAASFAAFLLSKSPTAIVLQIGSNDWAFEYLVPATWNAANFGVLYGYLVDAIRALNATVPIICLSPIRRNNEAANTQGNFLSAYRTAIANVVSTRSGLAVPPVYVDGLPIFTDNTNLPDGTHPDTPGQAIMKSTIEPYIL